MSTNDDDTVHTSVRQHLVSINISEEDVLEALNSLDPDKSSGIHTIGPRVLKNCAYSNPYVEYCIIYFQLASAIIPFHLIGESMLSLPYTSLVINPW